MDCHIHVAPGGGACKHVRFALHRSSDNALLGTAVFTRAELEEEFQDYDTAAERVKAQLVGIVLGNKGATPARLKTIIEAAVIRI